MAASCELGVGEKVEVELSPAPEPTQVLAPAHGRRVAVEREGRLVLRAARVRPAEAAGALKSANTKPAAAATMSPAGIFRLIDRSYPARIRKLVLEQARGTGNVPPPPDFNSRHTRDRCAVVLLE